MAELSGKSRKHSQRNCNHVTQLQQLAAVHLAYDLRATGIKVNSADPGWVKTEMGGEHALLEVGEGARTSVRLATLPDDGPSGGFFRLDEAFPW